PKPTRTSIRSPSAEVLQWLRFAPLKQTKYRLEMRLTVCHQLTSQRGVLNTRRRDGRDSIRRRQIIRLPMPKLSGRDAGTYKTKFYIFYPEAKNLPQDHLAQSYSFWMVKNDSIPSDRLSIKVIVVTGYRKEVRFQICWVA
ncbi:MAG: hypothetical protein M3O03_10550, partial [Pseudomonadota bacterium]|nr:hypothetical protein [Pseudomonadota bacterium]